MARALLTVVFAAIAAMHLLRSMAGPPRRVDARPTERVNDMIHLLMAVEMVAMCWYGPLRDRWGVVATVFAVATSWFLIQAIGPLPVRSRGACLQHAIIAAVTTWMIVVMPATGGSASTGPAPQMSGMAMPAASTAGTVAVGQLLAAVVGGYLLFSAPWWLVEARRGRQRALPGAVRTGWRPRMAWVLATGPVTGAISHAAMAAGMGAVLVAAR